MTTQFVKTYLNLYQELTPNAVTVLSLIINRYNLSSQRGYYSQDCKDYYVIYSNHDISQTINLSVATVGRIIQQLVSAGYLAVNIKHGYYRQLFLTAKTKQLCGLTVDNQGVAQNEQGVTQNEQQVRTNNYTNNTDITDITAQPVKQCKTTQQQQPSTANEQQARMQALINTLVKHVGLPTRTVNYFKQLAFNDPKLLYHYAGLLLKAKHSVSCRAANFAAGNGCLMFDENAALAECLNNNVYGILIKANKHGRNRDRYIVGAFVNMFKEFYNQQQAGSHCNVAVS